MTRKLGREEGGARRWRPHRLRVRRSLRLFGKTNPALWDVFGPGPLVKWLTIAVFSAVALAFVIKGAPRIGKQNKGYSWALTGVLIGVLTSVAWGAIYVRCESPAP